MSIAVAHPVRHDPSPYKHRISHSQSSRPPPTQYVSQPQHTHRPSASTSAQPSSSSHAAYDSYYGHEETAKICARFVSHTFSCPETLPPPPQSSTALEPSSRHPPIPPTLSHFVAYALHRTRLHNSVTFLALALLNRLKGRFPAARGSSGHRLFLAAFMLASKVACDDTYSNKSWAVVGQGMFALREVNQMEREMCGYLAWGLNVCGEELEAFEKEVRRIFRRPGPYSEQLHVSLIHGVGGPKPPVEDSRELAHLTIPESRIPPQLPTPTEAGPTAIPSFTKPHPPTISTNVPSKPHHLPSPPDSPPNSSVPTVSSSVAQGVSPVSPEGEEDEDSSSDDERDERRGDRTPSSASSDDSDLPTPPNSASSEPHVSATSIKRQQSLKYPLAAAASQKLAKSSSLPGVVSSASTYAQQLSQARASVPPTLNPHYREPMSVTAAHIGGTGIDAMAGMDVDGINARDLDDDRRTGTGYFAQAIRPHSSNASGAASGPSRTHLEKEMFAFSSSASGAAAGMKRERESSGAKEREAQKEREREREKGRERERETKKAAIYGPRESWSGTNGKIVSANSTERQERDKRSLKTFTVPCSW